MTTYVLDTGMVLGCFRGAGYAEEAERRFAFSSPPNIALICVVTVGEILSLSLQFRWSEEKKVKLDELLRKIPWVDINNSQTLEKYAEIDAYSQCKHSTMKANVPTPRNMGKNDLWIAATAAVLQATLLTTDGDFDHLNGTFLKVEYIEPNARTE